MSSKTKRQKHSAVMIMHYISLTWRSILFLILLFLWIANMVGGKETIMFRFEQNKPVIYILWAAFAAEMTFRFFPSPIRSPGCQKQFKRNYHKTGRTDIVIADNHATVLVALVLIVLNGAIGALNMTDILNDDFMLLLSSAFSVCDMICILFF
ncbi:MAG: hypothetical protein J6P87_04760, partial [Lachnospiraceae bacterium]|nr:hypothetical protein [Lachnospiraceae bacterium]